MTANCERCKRRVQECSSLDQQQAQDSPVDCEKFVDDPESYWNTGWV